MVSARRAAHHRRVGIVTPTVGNTVAQLKVVLRVVGLALPGLFVAGSAIWGALALYYSDLHSTAVRGVLCVAFALSGLLALCALWLGRWRWRAVGVFAVVFAVLVTWWSQIEPSNDRDWKTEVAVLPYVTFSGDTFTVHNIRNFSYRSETDFTPSYYNQTFDLRSLESADLIASYWAGPHIAHIFLSFGFPPDRHLAISIERRDERGEGYSTIKGLFKQYEIIYLVADERDVIRLRTNVRRDPPEDVYLYALRGSPDGARRLLMEYLRKINELHEHPQFYNTLTTNCTTNIWLHAHVNPGVVPWSWKILLSGHVPEYLYERGVLDTHLPFPDLQRRSHINAAARAADDAADFSTQIRQMSPPAGRPVSPSRAQ
jgi:hypothetical protein